MSSISNTEQINNVLSYVLVKKIMTRVNRTKAYKLGLVDFEGKTKRKPETTDEKSALSILDKYVFKLKRMLGPRINELSNFLYVNSLDSNIEDFLTVKGGAQNKASVKRVSDDLIKLKETYDLTSEDLITIMLSENINAK